MITTQEAVEHLTVQLQSDPDFALAWQANIAMPILDGCRKREIPMTHENANALADDLMLHLFQVKAPLRHSGKVPASTRPQEV